MGKLITGLVVASVSIFSLIILIVMKKNGHFFRYLFLSAITGITSVFAVNATGTFTGIHLNINPLTLISGIIFGSPGVAAHLIIQIIMK